MHTFDSWQVPQVLGSRFQVLIEPRTQNQFAGGFRVLCPGSQILEPRTQNLFVEPALTRTRNLEPRTRTQNLEPVFKTERVLGSGFWLAVANQNLEPRTHFREVWGSRFWVLARQSEPEPRTENLFSTHPPRRSAAPTTPFSSYSVILVIQLFNLFVLLNYQVYQNVFKRESNADMTNTNNLKI